MTSIDPQLKLSNLTDLVTAVCSNQTEQTTQWIMILITLAAVCAAVIAIAFQMIHAKKTATINIVLSILDPNGYIKSGEQAFIQLYHKDELQLIFCEKDIFVSTQGCVGSALEYLNFLETTCVLIASSAIDGDICRAFMQSRLKSVWAAVGHLIDDLPMDNPMRGRFSALRAIAIAWSFEEKTSWIKKILKTLSRP